MPRLQLLLFDTGIVIELHRRGLWGQIVSKHDITLANIVAHDEAQYWEDDSGEKHYFDLNADIESNRVTCIEVTNEQMAVFFAKFSPVYLDKLDAGEAESLAILLSSGERWLISSADAIVYKVLGRLMISEQGISLEEILQQTGLTLKDLAWQFTRKFREKYTKQGEQDSITGMGRRD